MASQPARKLVPAASKPVSDEGEFVPPVLRDKMDPAVVFADLERTLDGIRAGTVPAVDGERFLAELGREIQRLKA